MKHKAVSSVFIALFMIIVVPEPRASIIFSVATQYLNITNLGPDAITIRGLAFFQGSRCYTVPYTASLNSGQSAEIYLYSALKANETVAILTNEGALEFRIV